MRPQRFVFSASSTTAVAAAQTLGAAGFLVLGGATIIPAQPNGVAAYAKFDGGVNRPLTFTSTGNISGVTLTVVGFDASGNAVTSSIAGPNNDTISTTELYNRVISIRASAAVGTAMSAGTGTTGVTNWAGIDYYPNPANVGLWLQLTATINVDVQLTPDPIEDSTITPHTFNHGYLTAVTADAASALTYPATGVRMLVNSSSGSGAAVFTVIEAGLGRGR